jgi:hypothetical protein
LFSLTLFSLTAAEEEGAWDTLSAASQIEEEEAYGPHADRICCSEARKVVVCAERVGCTLGGAGAGV